MNEKDMSLIENQILGKFSWDELEGTEFIHKDKLTVVLREAIEFCFIEAKKEVFDDIENLTSIFGAYGDTPIFIKYKELKERHLSTFAWQKRHNTRLKKERVLDKK